MKELTDLYLDLISEGEKLSAQGDDAGAEALYREAILLDSEDFNAHNGLGIVLERLGETAAAEAEYREAMRLSSDDPWPPTNLGSLLRDQGRQAEAETAFRAAIRASPGHSSAHSGLGLALVDQEKRTEAEAAFREAIGCDPGNTDAHRGLGCVLWEAHRHPEAEEAFRTAIRLDPSHAWTHNNLGSLLAVDDGRLAEAEAEFRTAVSLDPANADARRNLAAITRGTAGPQAGPDDAARYLPGPLWRWRGSRQAKVRIPPGAAALRAWPPARARHRFFAGAFDYGPWVLLVFLFGPATVLTDPFTISMVLVYLLFNGLLEGISGQSIGKALFGLYTVRSGTGEFIGGGAGMYRRVLHVLDTLPLGAGWVAGLVTGRTFADRIAGTVVVRRPLSAAG
jgi:Flp pilus assembly protein TadD